MREHRPAYSELSEEERQKSICRSYSNVLQARGLIRVETCSECGADAEKHHPDYTDPRRVVWLCRRCHRRLHREEAVSLDRWLETSRWKEKAA